MSKMYEKEPWWLKVALIPLYPIWFTIGLAKSAVLVVKLIKSGVRPDSEEWVDEFGKKMHQIIIDETDK